jgi:SAM-dependent methyltransferase
MTFDGIATQYDTDFTHTPLACWLRNRVWSRLDCLFEPGMRILELGCGTGEDAVYLAKRGIQVIATDASPHMLRVTETKAAASGVKLEIQGFDLNQPSTWHIDGSVDGVYSNFGALNCTENWSGLGHWLAEKLPTGAKLGFGVMGRFCLWETVWHGLHLDWRVASRRWAGRGQATLEDGSTLPVYYPTFGQFRNALGDSFRQTDARGLGVFLPPSDSFGVVESRPRLMRHLINWEKRFGWRGYAVADHFWLELERR